MPRRAQLAAPVLKSASPQPDSNPDNLSILRTQWRWAAFSQFFFTFSPLFAMNDVSIAVCFSQQLILNDNPPHVGPLGY